MHDYTSAISAAQRSDAWVTSSLDSSATSYAPEPLPPPFHSRLAFDCHPHAFTGHATVVGLGGVYPPPGGGGGRSTATTTTTTMASMGPPGNGAGGEHCGLEGPWHRGGQRGRACATRSAKRDNLIGARDWSGCRLPVRRMGEGGWLKVQS